MLCRLYLLLAAAGVLLAGCATPNVNPSAPKARTGYVDFYTDTDLELSWEVKRTSDSSGEKKIVFSEFKPVSGNILRLASPPGTYTFSIWFMNCATEGLQTVQVQVLEGQVTPVHITLTPKGSTSVASKEYRFGGSSRGYARGTKIRSDIYDVFRVTAVPEEPRAYRTKEQMPYYSPAAP